MPLYYVSGQLGTAQLGADQLGQFHGPDAGPSSPPPAVAVPEDGLGYRWFEPDWLARKLLLEANDAGEGIR
jgi:hypothetical protein